MDFYTAIASWSGWPPVVALLLVIGGFGAFFFQKHIDILKEKNELLERELQERRNYAPDILAQRLAERHKLLQNELVVLAQDKEQDDQKRVELERELLKTRQDAEKMRRQLADVQEILEDMELPRDGKIRPHLAQDILASVASQSCIFIPVRLQRELNDQVIEQFRKNCPFKIEIIYPGMFKLYLRICDNENTLIGFIESPYWEIYYKDYFVTLLEILKHVPSEKSDQKAEFESESSTFLLTSEFHAISPIDPEIGYIKVLFDKNSLDKVLANPALTLTAARQRV